MADLYRVGRRLDRTVYRITLDGDELIGIMDTPELGALVVAALNELTPGPAVGVGYEQAIATLRDVAKRTGSPAARWAADYLAVDPDRRADAPATPASAGAPEAPPKAPEGETAVTSEDTLSGTAALGGVRDSGASLSIVEDQ